MRPSAAGSRADYARRVSFWNKTEPPYSARAAEKPSAARRHPGPSCVSMGCVLTTPDPKVVTVHNALMRESPAPPATTASRAIGLVKVYGSGEEAALAAQ